METIKTIDLNRLRDEAFQIAVEHGWHDEVLSTEHFLCLIISELMEAVQAEKEKVNGPMWQSLMNGKETISHLAKKPE